MRTTVSTVKPMKTAGLLALLLGLAACEGGGTVTRWEVRFWAPRFAGEFSNGDFVADGQRVSPSRVMLPDDELPGLACEHLTPAWDDTDFVGCGRVYARAKGAAAWEVVPSPPAQGPLRFLGQDRDGARYFFEASSSEPRLWALPPGASSYLPPAPLGVADFAEMHAFGLVVVGTDWARTPRAIEVEKLRTAPLRTFRNGAFSAAVESRFIDFEGHFYVLTDLGWDRVSPDGLKRDVSWFVRPTKNTIFDTLGVSSDGRLFALSTAKTLLSGADTRADNEIPIEALMSLGPGEREWVQASEPFSTPESRAIGYGLEKPYASQPGRDGSWWLSKCTANCAPNGPNVAAQSYVWQWRKPGGAKTSALRRQYTVWRDGVVTVQLPRYGDLQFWKLPARAADLGLSAVTAISLTTNLVIKASRTATLGKQSLVLQNDQGASETIELEVKGADALEREPPRRRVVRSLGAMTLWLDGAGRVHQRSGTEAPTLVAALPVPVQSLEGTFAHAVDGRVFRLELSGTAVTATPVLLPPIHSLHECAGLGVDGRVYLLVDGAAPIEGLTDLVSVSCHVDPSGNRRTTVIHTLDAAGNEAVVHDVSSFLMPQVMPASGTRAISRIGPLRTALGTDGRLVLDAASFGAGPLKSLDFVFRFAGSVGAETYLGDFALAVTPGGEAVVAFASGGGNTNIGYHFQPLTLPVGRSAVAMTAASTGQLVWLDDGSVFSFPAPDPQQTSSPSGTPLDLPGVALPSP